MINYSRLKKDVLCLTFLWENRTLQASYKSPIETVFSKSKKYKVNAD